MVEKVRMEWAVGRASAWGGGCGKVEQKAAQLMEDVRARGEKISVEERAREREGEE